MTVDELLARADAAELRRWRAYEQVTGTLGPERADLHAGIIAATIANVNRKKGKRALRADEFIPKWDRPTATTPEQMKTMLVGLTRKLGGKIRNRGG